MTVFSSLLGLISGIRVLSTDRAQNLPGKESQAEISNCSVKDYEDLTLCARLLTYQFRTEGTRGRQVALFRLGVQILSIL